MKRLFSVTLFLVSFLFASSSFALAAPSDQALSHIPVCPRGPNDTDVRCHAHVVTDHKGKPAATTSPTGLSPQQLQSAYSLTGASSSGRILAIVDAYGDANIKSDLDTYSAQFGLPSLPTCESTISTSSVPCFQKVDQNGGVNYPPTDSGWSLETSLDVEVAHGVCPDCKLLLIQANSSSYADLMKAVDRAVIMGASAVSNSYGSNEFFSETQYDSHFNHKGIAFTFSSGDNGYGTSYPAASKYVTAVGGTSLFLNSNNSYNFEAVWDGTGSGCSNYESKPSFQHDLGCPFRTIGDVAADADPNTGASVYDTVSYSGQTGWFQVGGTSLASPIIAGVYTLKGIPSGLMANSLPYANTPFLHDITSGRNGNCRRFNTYLCTGVVGYDGPTGFGTPNGINAF